MGKIYIMNKSLSPSNQAEQRKDRSRLERGLTLIEIIIVLVILSVVMGFLFKSIFSTGQQAKAGLSKTMLTSLKGPIFIFQMKNNSLPADLKAAETTDNNDAWGNPIQYRVLDSGRSYELKSLGADGRDGGAGADADILVSGP